MNPLLPPYISGSNKSLRRIKISLLQQLGESRPKSADVCVRLINALREEGS